MQLNQNVNNVQKLNLWIIFIILLNFKICLGQNQQNVDKPNIVIIMADDMGFDDVSFRGSNQFLTPNIDALAYSGVILNNLYTPSMCTPSRAAVLTGKYPINTGMQHYVIVNSQPWALPTNETTIAEIFQNNGYFTSIFGKWHMGMSRKAYTPTQRGFNKHFGYLGAYIDYYDHTLFSPLQNYSRGHDFRDNLAVTHEFDGTYVTDLLTQAVVKHIHEHNTTAQPMFLMLNHLAPHSGNEDDPLQAPEEEIEKFSYIKDIERRTYAAMVTSLDKSVGQVIDALSQKGVLSNTLILFYSDNGGPTIGLHASTASNYPFRGQKNSPWEGGIRSSAAIWSTHIEKLSTVWQQKIYVADLLPTLAAAAGIQLPGSLKLDGLNLWPALKYGYESVEREIVHNIDDIFQYVSYSKGKWKFINGTTEDGIYDGWLAIRSTDSTEIDKRSQHYEDCIRNTSVWQQLAIYNENSQHSNISELRANATINCQFEELQIGGVPCNPLIGPCLFDIDVDPCEQNNIYEEYKKSTIMLEMLESIEHFRQNAHQPNNKPKDPRCDPANFNNEWTWWEDEENRSSTLMRSSLNLFLSLVFLMCCL